MDDTFPTTSTKMSTTDGDHEEGTNLAVGYMLFLLVSRTLSTASPEVRNIGPGEISLGGIELGPGSLRFPSSWSVFRACLEQSWRMSIRHRRPRVPTKRPSDSPIRLLPAALWPDSFAVDFTGQGNYVSGGEVFLCYILFLMDLSTPHVLMVSVSDVSSIWPKKHGR